MKYYKRFRCIIAGLTLLPASVMANYEAERLPRVERDGLEFFLYEVDKDESLYGISKRFDWDIDEILAYNPEASGSLKKGFSLFYPTGRTITAHAKTPTSPVQEESLPELAEAAENNKISENTETPTGQNENDKEPSAVDNLPEESEYREEASLPVVLPDSVYVEDADSGSDSDKKEAVRPADPERELRLVLLVEDAASKRESEFAKGVLMALDAIKSDGKKVNLKIIQGPSEDKEKEIILHEIEAYEPELIFTTHEKQFPDYLLEYVNDNPAELVNVFDVKDASFTTNPGVIQMLTPSVSFSNDVASFAASRFRDRELVIIGSSESSDEVGSLMLELWPGATMDNVTPEMLAEMEFDENKSYLLYVNVTRKNDINEILTIICEKKQEYPLADISVFGRANWIVYADALNEKFFEADVFFPSRFYFETDSRRGKEFRNKFNSLFNHQPVKSFPMYSVAGFDEAMYFMNALRTNGGDWSRHTPAQFSPLQAEIRPEPVENGGFVNPVCYVIRFAPFKMIDKMPIK